MKEIIPYLNFTQLLVVLSFVYFLICFDKAKFIHKLLFWLLSLTFFIELFNFLLKVFERSTIVAISYSLFSIFFNCVWIMLLNKVFQRNYPVKFIMASYTIFGVGNLFLYEGINHFAHYNFIVGAFFYVFVFIYESFIEVKKENLLFFESNDYLLLVSPVIFMLGYSILMSFNNRTLNVTIVFAGRTLYDIIGYFINFIYYSLLAIYCYREKKTYYV